MSNPIPLHFESELRELSNRLKMAEGYLACENIIIQTIKKQSDNGHNDDNIEIYLKKLSDHIEILIAENQLKSDCTNYRYASGFLMIVLKTPSWSSWVKTIDM